MNNVNASAQLLPHVRLMFEIDNPSLEECYRHGYLMSKEGVDESENPFLDRGASRESELWIQGWWDCFYGEEPLFSLEPALSTQILTNAQKIHWSEDGAVNEEAFEDVKGSTITTVAKLAAAIAGALLSYQVIDLIA